MANTPDTFEAQHSRGCYHYLLNGESTDIGESWARRELSPGQFVTRSSRTAPGVEISVCARESAGRVQQFEAEWSTDGDAPFRVRASYALGEEGLEIRRSCGDEPAECEKISFSDGGAVPLLSPLMRIFTGPVIARLLADGGVGRVVVPSIAEPDNRQQLLRPMISERRANVLCDSEDISLNGHTFPARRCEYLGDQYAPGTRFWLGPDDTLLRYCWHQDGIGDWDVGLECQLSACQTGV